MRILILALVLLSGCSEIVYVDCPRQCGDGSLTDTCTEVCGNRGPE